MLHGWTALKLTLLLPDAIHFGLLDRDKHLLKPWGQRTPHETVKLLDRELILLSFSLVTVLDSRHLVIPASERTVKNLSALELDVLERFSFAAIYLN